MTYIIYNIYAYMYMQLLSFFSYGHLHAFAFHIRILRRDGWVQGVRFPARKNAKQNNQILENHDPLLGPLSGLQNGAATCNVVMEVPFRAPNTGFLFGARNRFETMFVLVSQCFAKRVAAEACLILKRYHLILTL